MNLLLGAVCSLIPVVGPIALSGWLIGLFWARRENDNPAEFPPFDFQNFVKYLERGLWPFVVSLVAVLALIPVFLVLIFGFMILASAFDSHSEAGKILFGLMMFLSIIVYLVMIIGLNFILVPLLLKAAITQDFVKAFDLKFVKAFLALVWLDLLNAIVFLIGVGIVMLAITVITCYIGGFLLSPVIYFTWMHLQKQLYMLYLERGGEAVPLSEKLNDLPPALPQG